MVLNQIERLYTDTYPPLGCDPKGYNYKQSPKLEIIFINFTVAAKKYSNLPATKSSRFPTRACI